MHREPIPHPRRVRQRLTGVVAPAVVGSIALSLSAQPAVAAEPQQRDTPFGHDARALRPAAPTAVQPASRPDEHVVGLGDTVSRIAAQHGLRTADLLAWNGLDWSAVIRPGDVIRLSGSSAPSTTAAAPGGTGRSHTVAAGETPWSIAHAAGVGVDELLGANGLAGDAVIFPGQTLTVPGSGPATPAADVAAVPAAAPIAAGSHTVGAGDTLSAIAAQHGLGLDAVLAANALDRSSIIYPGQSLVIPGAAAAPAAVVTPALDLGLDAEQIANARLIIQVGRDRGVPDRGIAIALATAMVESWIRNLDWGDRDSLGLFQQRPSTGWGTPDQVRDPVRSTATFFGGAGDPNGADTRGLLDIPGWESLPFTDAAQAVQVSAHPERYGQWEQQAYLWLAALG
ncbi:muramidase family protein [Microbacterium thalli]|uniref:LysM peptidoglycan-binding domain-containing protein n=1 Tax=Microbacterium thalli TaxID=3027921 RepID=A0ABT5SHY3_9MICO|nr:LysM peptidoglycan-binding domain-containing protein [Microbacterium thalli]MDD7962382.1 LysM peptidoglycan-binding domain-containing protein [Microbacterium thalli]MDN8549288.1 LysM peptidoglycan-binding domain-containing protein [Microbacterium thalli]